MKIDVINDYFSKILEAYKDVKEIKSFSFGIEIFTDDQYIQKRTYSITDQDFRDLNLKSL